MSDSGKIIIGLIVFLIVMTFPIWYNLVCGVTPLEEPVAATKYELGRNKCVRPVEYMKTNHMDLLNQWRDDVVRYGDRYTVGPDGNPMEKSLSNTCLDCHANKEEFCDRCHNYMSVDPYCWDCHTIPSEVGETEAAMQTDPEEEN